MEDRIQRTKAGRERRRSWTRERRGGAGWKTGSRRRSAGIELQQKMRKWGGGVHGCRGVHGRSDCRVRWRGRERRKQEKKLLALHFPFLRNIRCHAEWGKTVLSHHHDWTMEIQGYFRLRALFLFIFKIKLRVIGHYV
jgi:hypothetical protein